MSDQPPPESQLSGTLADTVRRFTTTLSNLSTLLVAGGIGSVILAIIILSTVSDLRIYGFILLGIGMALLVLSLAVSLGPVTSMMGARQGRYGTNTLVMVVAFVGILGLVNFLVFENPSRWDVTATKQFSLSPRTAELLENLKEPVQVIAFFSEADPRQASIRSRVDDVLHEFTIRSDQFSYRFVDPDVDPVTAQTYRITQYATVVFEGMESQIRHPVTSLQEQDFVTGLLIATGQERKQVVFLTGHGEGDISTNNADAFLSAREGLERDNYGVLPLDLLQLGPENMDLLLEDTGLVVIVAGPRQDLREDELEALHGFLKRGGRMVFLMEPDTPDSFRQLLRRWGVILDKSYILDRASFVSPNPAIPLLSQANGNYPFSYIPELTGVLDRTFYPGVTGILPVEEVLEEGNTDIIFLPLAVTSPASWLVDTPEIEPQEGADAAGPQLVATAIIATAPLGEEPLFLEPENVEAARFVVFGDSNFASNQHFSSFNNSDFFLNSVNWLTGDVSLISIRPKQIVFRELVLTRNQFDFIRYSSYFLLPSLMVIAGIFVWWRRR